MPLKGFKNGFSKLIGEDGRTVTRGLVMVAAAFCAIWFLSVPHTVAPIVQPTPEYELSPQGADRYIITETYQKEDLHYLNGESAGTVTIPVADAYGKDEAQAQLEELRAKSEPSMTDYAITIGAIPALFGALLGYRWLLRHPPRNRADLDDDGSATGRGRPLTGFFLIVGGVIRSVGVVLTPLPAFPWFGIASILLGVGLVAMWAMETNDRPKMASPLA